MAKIVVLGAGLGGMSAAYEIKALLGAAHAVTVVGDGPRFSFTPSNPWVAVGWRQPDEIQLEAAVHLRKRGIEFIDDPAAEIRPAENRLLTKGGRSVPYDYLVITTGPRLAFDEVPGLGPDGHTQSVCTTPHASAAWAAYQAFLQQPGPIVVGAAQGASCFGPAYEFAMILDADLRKRKLRDKVPMTFVTSEPYIGHMGLGGVGDSRGLMEAEMRQRHIRWIANARIKEVRLAEMRVEELDAQGKVAQEHALPFAYSMVIPAFTGVDAVRAVEGLVNPRGFVQIDQHQRNPKYPNIFSAGVCVAIPPVEPTPVPTGAPKTGFMIESMVTAIATNLRDELAGRPATAEATWNAVCLADMGDTGAAFVALPQIPPRNVTWTRIGKWVHVAKVAFEKYYLGKLRSGNTEPIYEKYIFKALGIERLKPAGGKR
ncbi:MAG: FAD/NAD(P)-binding oxidoreductase [Mizugakiibacter sp.]|uniref:NAD(P)/FAD-dependent oxidoreductase n=1 Tax=Mizugakiibacter sp. TaxID=1972610 RepID=UPI0031C8664C|nr:NAD(P)/FAD-dependent oxidoreductase [Xanthomonadaceae bacterium]